MTAFRNLKIGLRLGAGFAALIVITLLVALVGRLQLGRAHSELRLLLDDRLPKVDMVVELRDNARQIAANIRSIVLFTDEAGVKAVAKEVNDLRARNATLVQELDKVITSPEGQRRLDDVAAKRQAFNASVDKVIKLGLTNDPEDAKVAQEELRTTTDRAEDAYIAALTDLVVFQKKLMRDAVEDTSTAATQAGWAMLIAAAVAAGLGIAIALGLTRSIVGPIRRAVSVAETVADGDLRQTIEVDRQDEAGELLGALRRMNESLVTIVGGVRGNADSVATASGQIAQGNADLSQRTEEQAANLQQTAASMEELTATVNHNTDTARQAAQMAESAARVASQAGEVMGQMVATMDEITASSKKIADIIGTIDGIAFQTNILALNAAVEAARAGEQGRGFAVVAGEVRTLAQRSAEAAKEIKTLIGSSVDRVEAGNGLAAQAGQTVGEVVGQVRRVADLIEEISAASSEQSKGIGQVGDAVQQLDQVTQQNAALVEESAAAADSLQQQARALAEAVSVFRLSGDGARAATGAPKAKAPAPVAKKPSLGAPKRPAPKPAAQPAAAPKAAATAAPRPAPAPAPADDGDWTSF